MTETKPTGKTVDELAVGEWIAPGVISALAAEVLHTLTYPHPGGTGRTHLVLREFGQAMPFDETYETGFPVSLATEEELADIRAGADRAQRIADIRAFAAWLEANPWAPMPRVDASVHLDERHIGAPSVAESYRKIYEVAERLGVKPEERLDDRTVVRKDFGRIDYSVIAWHLDGRPVEPEPECSAACKDANRPDRDDHFLGCPAHQFPMPSADGGPVDETSVACTCDTNPLECDVHGPSARASTAVSNRARGLVDETDAPRELLALAVSEDGGVAFALAQPGAGVDPVLRAKAVELTEAIAEDPRYALGVIVGDTAEEQTSNAYAAYERDEAAGWSDDATGLTSGGLVPNCPTCGGYHHTVEPCR